MKYIALALGALAIMSLAAVTGPTKSAQAQAPEPAGEWTITIYKACDDDVVALGLGPFEFLVDFDFTAQDDGNGGLEEFDEDFWGTDVMDTLDEPVTLDCNTSVVLEGDDVCGDEDDDACLPEEGTLDDVIYFVCDQGDDSCDDSGGDWDDILEGGYVVTETGTPGIISEFSGDCDVLFVEEDPEEDPGTDGDTTDVWNFDFSDNEEDPTPPEGLLCIITNSVDEEAIPNLIITKVCLTGDGDGDADFGVTVKDDLGAIVDFDSLDCGDVMVVADLEPGLYQIQELITGPNGNNFETAISCTSDAGQVVTPGTIAQVELEIAAEEGDDPDVHCQIVNAFQDPGDPGAPGDPPCNCAPTVIVPIDIDNTNDNLLDNDNLNDNNNENTNTQEQSNFQEQTNDNNQTTTVNSSPSVVIDFD